MHSKSRTAILERIEAAGNRRPSIAFNGDIYDTDILKPILPNAIECFKTELEAINGQCIRCNSEDDLYQKLQDFLSLKNNPQVFVRDSYIQEQLKTRAISCTSDEDHFEDMEVGITSCEFLIARTGSVIVSSASQGGRRMNVFPPIHIVLAHTSQLVSYPTDGMAAMQEKYGNHLPSLISTITGPSRTADIEKTLVLGAHGPKEFVVFLSEF